VCSCCITPLDRRPILKFTLIYKNVLIISNADNIDKDREKVGICFVELLPSIYNKNFTKTVMK